MDNNTNNTNKEQQVETKTYTQAEVDDLLQRETDRRVTSALMKQQKKFDEAQKLANMSADEKSKYEYDQKMAELTKREQELTKKELMLETEKQLREKGLPTEAAQFIVAIDAENTKTNIKAFEAMFNKAIETEINKRIATGAPKVGTGSGSGITQEQFRKMSLSQQAQIYRTNPELYNALTGR